MNNSAQLLHDIASSYEKAELTCLAVQKKGTQEYLNLLTLIELVPSEQPDSPSIGDHKFPHLVRHSKNDYIFYLSRLSGQSIVEMLTLYEKAEAGLAIKFPNGPFRVNVQDGLIQEPPDDRPLLVDSKNEKTVGRVLPYRLTTCRVWSKINLDKQWLNTYDVKFFTELGVFSQKNLGYDLTKIPEHLGNIYLFGCNPLLRSWETELLDFDRDLLVRCMPRNGRSVIGAELILEEHRADNRGFFLRCTISSLNQRISLPYFPDVLEIKIIDQQGVLIDRSYGSWANFSIIMGVQHSIAEYHVNTPNGEQVFSVPKKTTEKEIKIGEYNWTGPHYLRNALRARRFEDLATSKEFVFFPIHPDTSKKATQVIRELLNKAQKKCMILDPYFGETDLIYAFQIENISLTVQIISSAQFLAFRPKVSHQKKSKWGTVWSSILALFEKSLPKAPTYLERLIVALNSYQNQFPQQKIQCRVLVGRKSPLHDRFIVVDDEVYLLGSSLNEFGSRTTTLIKVPHPKEMIEQADKWWNDDEHCPLIEDFNQQREDDYDL